MNKKTLLVIFITILLSVSIKFLNESFLDFLIFSPQHFYENRFEHRNPYPADTSIILIENSELTRSEIVKAVEIVSENNPKVIALFNTFHLDRKEQEDSILIAKFKNIQNLVLLNPNDSSDLVPNVSYTNSSLIVEEDLSVSKFRKGDSLSFEKKVVELYDAQNLLKLSKQFSDETLINFKGKTYGHFYYIESYQLFEDLFLPEQIKNKIVIFGNLAYSPNDIYNSFKTPLDTEYFGSYKTDFTSATIISANAIATIIQEDYLYELPWWSLIVLAILLIFLNKWISVLVLSRFNVYIFLLVATVVLIIESLSISLFQILLFSQYNLVLDLSKLPIILIIGFLVFAYNLKKLNEPNTNIL